MKKTLALMMALLLLLCPASFAEEEFTLHNGVTFGMTKDEVMQKELENGFGVDQGIYGEGTIAGIYGAVRYEYTLGEVSKCCYFYYDPSQSSYTTLSTGLTNKYGASQCNSTNGLSYPVSADGFSMTRKGIFDQYNALPITCKSIEGPVYEYRQEGSWCYYRYMFQTPLYEQWLIPQDDGTAVLIDHALLTEYYLMIETSSDEPAGDVYTNNYELIIYTRLSADAVQALQQNAADINDDL